MSDFETWRAERARLWEQQSLGDPVLKGLWAEQREHNQRFAGRWMAQNCILPVRDEVYIEDPLYFSLYPFTVMEEFERDLHADPAYAEIHLLIASRAKVLKPHE